MFKQVRPNDINIEVPVSAKPQELVYNIFNDLALNTFSAEEAAKKQNIPGYFLVEKKQITTRTLADLLDEYLPKGKVIDFLNIDVEGLDFEVLTSNNWEKYRPEFVLVEDLSRRSIDLIIKDSQIFKFMVSRGYVFVAKTLNTLFFRKSSPYNGN